jgi:hypothetical protein
MFPRAEGPPCWRSDTSSFHFRAGTKPFWLWRWRSIPTDTALAGKLKAKKLFHRHKLQGVRGRRIKLLLNHPQIQQLLVHRRPSLGSHHSEL